MKKRHKYKGQWFDQSINISEINDRSLYSEVNRVIELLREYSELEKANARFLKQHQYKDYFSEILDKEVEKRNKLLNEIILACEAPGILKFCKLNRESELFLDLLFIQKKALALTTLPLAPNDARARSELFKRWLGDGKWRRMLRSFPTEFKYNSNPDIAFFIDDRIREFYCEYMQKKDFEYSYTDISVTYLNDTQKNNAKAGIQDGLIFLDNNLVTTPPLYVRPKSSIEAPVDYRQYEKNMNYFIYVMDSNKDLFLKEEATEEMYIKHSSFFCGGPVLCAGTIEISNGKLQLITNESGHYQPTPKNMYHLLKNLKEKGIDLSDVNVVILGKGYNAERFLRMKGFCLPDNEHSKARTIFLEKNGIKSPLSAQPNESVIEKIKLAVNQYIEWMNGNAKGIRGLNRFSHWHHGKNGIQRAEKLLQAVNTEQPMNDIITLLKNVMVKSSDTNHSLKNFLKTEFGKTNLEDLLNDSDLSFNFTSTH